MNPEASAQTRYRHVTWDTFGGSTDGGLTSDWFNKIKPTLTQGALAQHYATLVCRK